MLVVISIIAVLAAFAVPALTSALTKGQMTGTLNNGRQLYLAGQQMALDGTANSDPTLTWPGDASPAITSTKAYVNVLIAGDYIKAGDVQKLFSGPGSVCLTTITAGTPTTIDFPAAAKTAIKLYQVKDSDSSNTIFAVSNNYTYNNDLTTATSPFGDKGFIVQHKGGDASILRKNQAKVVAPVTDSQFQSTVGKVVGDVDGTASTTDTGADGRTKLTFP